jgi:hypothetical protein
VEHTEAWEAIIPDLGLPIDVSSAMEVDHDARDFIGPDPTVPFLPIDAPISQASYFKKVASDVKKHLDRNETLELTRNRPLRLVSRPGEPPSEFMVRCEAEATKLGNAEKATAVRKFETRLRTAQRQYEDAVAAADLATQAMEDRRNEAIFGFGFDLLTGRKPRLSRARTSGRDRVRRTETKVEAKRDKIDDLNTDLEEAVDHIDEEWATKASDIEDVTIGLEADDIEVTEVRLIWIRVQEPNADGT